MSSFPENTTSKNQNKEAITRTIHYNVPEGENSISDQVQSATFVQDVTTDLMTGKVTTGEWQPASFDAIDLTQIPDWTSLVDGKETKQLPAVDLKYGDKSITVEVTFTKTENKEATRTIHYQVTEGQAAKDDTVQTVAFQRTVSTDENGKTNYGA
ncbi:mucin-binding protein [Lactobacillus amylolyticus]|nr:hypothetical protein [Lactobacillus amylolyticus]